MAQHSVPGAAPYPPSFTSPIPISRTHLGNALASEWTKIRTVRSTLWSLGLMILLVVGIGLLMTTTVGDDEYDTSPILSFGLPGVLFGQLCVVTLGVLVITSEYGTGMIRTTLTACPQRARVLTAKALVFGLLTLVLATAACSLVALVNWASLSGREVTRWEYTTDAPGTTAGPAELSDASTGELVRATLGAGLFIALLGLLALAVGTLLRHTAGAITTMLGVLLLPLLVAVFMPAGDMQEKLIEYSAPNIVATLYGIPMQGEGSGWGLLAMLAAVTALALGAAYAVLQQRDV